MQAQSLLTGQLAMRACWLPRPRAKTLTHALIELHSLAPGEIPNWGSLKTIFVSFEGKLYGNLSRPSEAGRGAAARGSQSIYSPRLRRSGLRDSPAASALSEHLQPSQLP